MALVKYRFQRFCFQFLSVSVVCSVLLYTILCLVKLVQVSKSRFGSRFAIKTVYRLIVVISLEKVGLCNILSERISIVIGYLYVLHVCRKADLQCLFLVGLAKTLWPLLFID